MEDGYLVQTVPSKPQRKKAVTFPKDPILGLSSTILHAAKKWNYRVRIFSLTVSSNVLNVFDIKKP